MPGFNRRGPMGQGSMTVVEWENALISVQKLIRKKSYLMKIRTRNKLKIFRIEVLASEAEEEAEVWDFRNRYHGGI